MLSVKIFVFNPFMENTLVVYDDHTREAAIVDCGCLYDTERNELKKFIADNNLSVKYLLNTHLHLDHQFGNAWAVISTYLRTASGRNCLLSLSTRRYTPDTDLLHLSIEKYIAILFSDTNEYL